VDESAVVGQQKEAGGVVVQPAYRLDVSVSAQIVQ